MKNIRIYIVTIAMFVAISVNGQAPPLISVKTQNIPNREVNSEVWSNTEYITVNVHPQNITPPILQTPTINNIKVSSINDGQSIAFLLEWTDSTKDSIVDADKFCDQVAIQLPYDISKNPNFMMGNKNGRVHIIHWKASWQNDIENGFRDVKNAYPNYWTDIYPLLERKSDGISTYAKDISLDQYKDSNTINYMHGTYAGNPMSNFDRKDPSEENIAEGYGSLTTQELQNATGWGIWKNNTWKVIFTRPLTSPDTSDAPLPEKTKIAFAVWNGTANNIGARKHYSMWIELTINK